MRSALLVFALAAACTGTPAQTPPASPADQARGTARDSGPQMPRGPADSAAIVLGTVDGTETRLAAHRARVTVVAMWASFCAPCLRELHLIEALHRHYQDQPDVTVLLVSIDEFDPESRAKVAAIVAERSLATPVFIDHKRALMERLAPRDKQGKAHYTVPMVVVIDEHFGLRRVLDLDHQVGEAPFVGHIAPLVDAALRGETPPPETPYEPPLGTGFTRRAITVTVPERLSEHQITHYLDDFRHQLTDMYPDLHDHQLDELMTVIETKLRAGGTFTIEIPAGHTGAH